MKFSEVLALSKTKPTFMRIFDEIDLIESLMSVDENELIDNLHDFANILSDLSISHGSAGLFELDYSDEETFFKFAAWLEELARKHNIRILEEHAEIFTISVDEMKRAFAKPKKTTE